MNLFETVITEEAKQRVLDCLNSERLSEGELVREFEKELEDQFGYTNCVAVNSASSALHLALLLSMVGDGDEVILPAQTFVATAMAVLWCGGKPIFADIDCDTGNISVDSVSKMITDKTKAVIAVSWGGNPTDLYQLEDVCKQHNLALIQDNAQALGAEYNGHPIDHFGDFSCFSFQAIKHVTTGDGGALMCRKKYQYDLAREWRWFGINRETDLLDETGERLYNLDSVGWKYHMNNLSAALGLGNLFWFVQRQQQRDNVAQYYDAYLPKTVRRTFRNKGSANWLYTILVDRRNDFIKAMAGRGIPTAAVHKGIDRNEVFGGYQDLPNQRFWDEHMVCLPIHHKLEEEDCEAVVKAVKKGW